MAQIKDFGAKIGGARKDLWKLRGLMIEDIDDMTTLERKKYIKKDNIWPKINFQELLDSGIPRSVIYWRNEIRKAVKPTFCEKISEEDYIEGVRTIRDMVEEVREERDILTFSEKARSGIILDKTFGRQYHYVGNYEYIVNGNAVLRYGSAYNIAVMKVKMDKKNFLMTENQIMEKDFPIVQITGPYHYELVNGNDSIVKEVARGKHYYYPVSDNVSVKDATGKYMLLHGNRILYISESRKDCEEEQGNFFDSLNEKKAQKKNSHSKKKWEPFQFKNLVMNTSSSRKGNVTGDFLIESFGIVGGEFGNWANDAERQKSLDYTYDSFCDISAALGIDFKSTSLPYLSKKGLSIAFGARGRGSALAHYEPMREVINITKLRGAGSLGHEWAHALDHMIGQCYGCAELATEECSSELPLQLKKVLRTMRFKNNGDFTDYYKGSSKFNSTYAKEGHGYWTSACEMFARAFSCYLEDKLKEKGYRNDYLCGHSDSFVFTEDETGKRYYAYPRGEERKRINEALDELINFLKEDHFLKKISDKKPVSKEIFYSCSSDGQMCFA